MLKQVIKEIRDKNTILCASVHHTGTWFILNFLLEHPKISELREMREIVEGAEIPENGIVHVHITGEGINSRGVIKSASFEELSDLVHDVKVVTPLRDPLLSLISRQERHPELDHYFIVDAFTKLPNLNSTFVNVDIGDDLSRVIKELELPYSDYIDRWEEEWPSFNTRGDYELKKWYEHGNIDLISKEIEEFQYLKDREKEIRPFLEEKGYKELIWWK